MEVPCCGGALMIVQEAMKNAGVDLPVDVTVISAQGDIVKE